MAITISMIETKEFKFAEQGYEPEEVDFFLDEIVDEIESLQNEIKNLKDEAARLRRSQAQAAPVQRPQGNEDAAHKILVKAQQVYDETLSDASTTAEEIKRTAQREADTIIRDAREENMRLQEDMRTLRAAVSDYRDRFRRLVEDQSHLLNADKEL